MHPTLTEFVILVTAAVGLLTSLVIMVRSRKHAVEHDDRAQELEQLRQVKLVLTEKVKDADGLEVRAQEAERREAELREAIPGIIQEKITWQQLYYDQAMTNDNAQAWQERDLNRLRALFKAATGVEAPARIPESEQARALFVEHHGEAIREHREKKNLKIPPVQ